MPDGAYSRCCLREILLPLPGLLVLEGEVLPPVVLVNNSTFPGSRMSSQEKQCRFENSDLFSPENVLPNLVKISCWGDLRGWFPSYNESIFKQSKFRRYSIDDTAVSVKMRGCFSICQTFSFLRISCGPLRYLAAIKSSFIPFIHFQMTEECNLENRQIRQPFSFKKFQTVLFGKASKIRNKRSY